VSSYSDFIWANIRLYQAEIAAIEAGRTAEMSQQRRDETVDKLKQAIDAAKQQL
jgi:hypothetical protein